MVGAWCLSWGHFCALGWILEKAQIPQGRSTGWLSALTGHLSSAFSANSLGRCRDRLTLWLEHPRWIMGVQWTRRMLTAKLKLCLLGKYLFCFPSPSRKEGADGTWERRSPLPVLIQAESLYSYVPFFVTMNDRLQGFHIFIWVALTILNNGSFGCLYALEHFLCRTSKHASSHWNEQPCKVEMTETILWLRHWGLRGVKGVA